MPDVSLMRITSVTMKCKQLYFAFFFSSGYTYAKAEYQNQWILEYVIIFIITCKLVKNKPQLVKYISSQRYKFLWNKCKNGRMPALEKNMDLICHLIKPN